ncbi:MAG: TatD family hydrolase [Alistipes sp.]|nr:TatD family hydrolase [Alistipes sp.]
MSRYIDIHTHHFTARHTELRAVGIHPWDAENTTISEEIFSGAQAIGEIGLDYACEVSRERQEEVFRAQLAIAEHMRLPVVLHCVRAFAPMMAILGEYKLKAVIFHGFIGSKEQAAEAVKRGCFLSFGERTLRSPKTIEALRSTPLDNLFLETDESATPIEEIYAMAAEIRGEELETIINGITNNYNRLFQL